MDKIWLIICSGDDQSAIWTYEHLKNRGMSPIELINADQLDLRVKWEHRVDSSGVHIEFILPNGLKISNKNLHGVLNRLTEIPYQNLMLIHPGDKTYVQYELFAFFLSWLYSLPNPMLNRPSPFGLSGQSRHISEWVWLASQAGLPIPNYVQSSHGPIPGDSHHPRIIPAGAGLQTAIVIDGHSVIGIDNLPLSIQEGCIKLAQLSGLQIIGIDLAISETGWVRFAGATPMPDLRLGGIALLDQLEACLRQPTSMQTD